jgi:hypothetical protein
MSNSCHSVSLSIRVKGGICRLEISPDDTKQSLLAKLKKIDPKCIYHQE